MDAANVDQRPDVKLELVPPRAKFCTEDHASLRSLIDALLEERKPANASQMSIIHEIALSYVRLQRARRLETRTLDRHMAEARSRRPELIENDQVLAVVFAEQGSKLLQMSRAQQKFEAAWYRAIGKLDRAQKVQSSRDATDRLHVVVKGVHDTSA